MENLYNKIDNLYNKIDNLDNKINSLNNKINNLQNSLEYLENKINKLEKYGIRMNNHITFIEYTYQTLIKPINYIKNYFSNDNIFIFYKPRKYVTY